LPSRLNISAGVFAYVFTSERGSFHSQQLSNFPISKIGFYQFYSSLLLPQQSNFSSFFRCIVVIADNAVVSMKKNSVGNAMNFLKARES
jgi:hypothetical protein